MLNRLIGAAMKRTVLILVLPAIILVWGEMSAYRMQRGDLPPVNHSALLITVQAPSYLAEEIKHNVTTPIEQAVRAVEDLQLLETNSFNGGLLISLYFPLHDTMDRAERDVNEALKGVDLPAGTGEPTVTRIRADSFPIMKLKVTSPSGKVDEETLRTTVQAHIADELLQTTGVSEVRGTGSGDNTYVLSIRMDKLAKAGLTVDHVRQSLDRVNDLSVQGRLADSVTFIPFEAAGRSPYETDWMDAAICGDHGQSVPLSSVATLSPSLVDWQTTAKIGGVGDVVVDIFKEPSANLAEVLMRIRGRLSGMTGYPPEDVKLTVLFDQGTRATPTE
ncbi:efflux RND transporter permease subunit [Paenibacillus cellulositrophicus]|uniref:efflux RND transporter permease subunit n=1 Tax=Paenibacillus cellulositrophicus TaxID=562959 RepID=UPI003F7E6ADC